MTATFRPGDLVVAAYGNDFASDHVPGVVVSEEETERLRRGHPFGCGPGRVWVLWPGAVHGTALPLWISPTYLRHRSDADDPTRPTTAEVPDVPAG